MRIAVLDDDLSQTDLVCQVLASAGHACHPFQSGKEMLSQLRRESYDMLIIDWQAAIVAESAHRSMDVGPVGHASLFWAGGAGAFVDGRNWYHDVTLFRAHT